MINYSSSISVASTIPSIIIARLIYYLLIIWSATSLKILIDSHPGVKKNTSILSYNRLQDLPIFSAVSNLSPVNIQTLIFAFKKSAKVSGTSSYNLSSTAVAPISVKSFSI